MGKISLFSRITFPRSEYDVENTERPISVVEFHRTVLEYKYLEIYILL